MNEIEAFINRNVAVAESTLEVHPTVLPILTVTGAITGAKILNKAVTPKAGKQNCVQSPLCFGTSFVPPVALSSNPSFTEVMDVRKAHVG